MSFAFIAVRSSTLSVVKAKTQNLIIDYRVYRDRFRDEQEHTKNVTAHLSNACTCDVVHILHVIIFSLNAAHSFYMFLRCSCALIKLYEFLHKFSACFLTPMFWCTRRKKKINMQKSKSNERRYKKKLIKLVHNITHLLMPMSAINHRYFEYYYI